MRPPIWLIALLAACVTAAAIAALVIWLRWPVECAQTSIGFELGSPDPNIHACRTRTGAIVSLDAARISAVLWGQAAAIAALAAGGTAAWRFGRLPDMPRLPRTPPGPTVAVLGGALVLGLLVTWLLWPDTCTEALRALPSGHHPLVCSTSAGIALPRETARLTAVLWGEATVAAILAIGVTAIWRRGRHRLPIAPL